MFLYRLLFNTYVHRRTQHINDPKLPLKTHVRTYTKKFCLERSLRRLTPVGSNTQYTTLLKIDKFFDFRFNTLHILI